MANEIGAGIDVTMVAGAAITEFRIVCLDSTATQVVHPSATTSVPFGVAQESAASGAPVRVRIFGASKLEIHSAIAAIGTVLGIGATTGRADDIASTIYPIGYSLSTGANQGEIISAMINPTLTPRA